MSKIDEVRSAMVAAMKARDKDRKDSLSALLSALKNKAIDKRADLTEEEENQVILKEIKQTQETLELTPPDRTDIIEECKSRIAVLQEFAPHMWTRQRSAPLPLRCWQDSASRRPPPRTRARS